MSKTYILKSHVHELAFDVADAAIRHTDNPHDEWLKSEFIAAVDIYRANLYPYSFSGKLK